MDTITHLALGAVIGEAIGAKQLGKKVLLYGALSQSLPDVDSLAVLWLNPADNLLAHRGLTHSIMFVGIMSSVLAFVAHRLHGSMSVMKWTIFFGIQLIVHILIDSLNAYGIAWFEPFSHHRFSYHVLFVADPFFTLPLIFACAMLTVSTKGSSRRMLWVRLGLMFCCVYVGYACYNKVIIERNLKKAEAQLEIKPSRSFTTPTPFNNWLWYAVTESDSGFYVSYHSVFDSYPDTTFTFFKQDSAKLGALTSAYETMKLLQFSQGYYTVELWSDTVVLNVLRFGQTNGWHDRKAPFAFHYYLQRPEENIFVVQRGRFSGWNKKTVESFIRRIQGN